MNQGDGMRLPCSSRCQEAHNPEERADRKFTKGCYYAKPEVVVDLDQAEAGFCSGSRQEHGDNFFVTMDMCFGELWDV